MDAKMMQIADIAAHAVVAGSSIRVRLAEAELQRLDDENLDATGALQRAKETYNRINMDFAAKGV